MECSVRTLLLVNFSFSIEPTKIRSTFLSRNLNKLKSTIAYIYVLFDNRRGNRFILKGEKLPFYRSTEHRAVLSFMGYLKGKSSLMIYEQYGNLKFRIGIENFDAEGIM